MHNITNSSDVDFDSPDIAPWEQTFRNVINEFEIYWTPAVVLFGVCGNVTSLLVFICTPLKRMSWSVYLAALSVSDTGFLICVFVSWCNVIGLHLYHTQGWCQFFVYLTYVCGFLSVWYIVAFTVERYIVVCFPLRRQEVCSPQRARWVVGGLAVFSLVLYTFATWTSAVKPMHGYSGFCISEDSALLSVMANIDMVITLIIPFIIILVLNSIIIYTVLKYNRKRISMTTLHFHRRKGDPLCRGKSPDDVIVATNEADSAEGSPVCSTITGGQARVKNSKSIVHMTKMLVIVSSSFLLLNLPSHIIRICAFLTTFIEMNTYLLTTFRKLFLCIYYANFAINFLLYNACGGTFRNALKKLLYQMKISLCRKLCGTHIRSQSSVNSRKNTCVSVTDTRLSNTKLANLNCNHLKPVRDKNTNCQCQTFSL